ncbi:GGDEF domain-containing protein, partial [Arthrospira platensis SPKY2]
IGVVITALSVWHGLPFETALFHAAEAGAAIEGTLLALALAYRMRSIQSAHEVAEKLSRTDPLTGLLNRRAFADRGEGLWSTATRNDRPLSMVLLDLDHFKQLNDQFGHTAGDDALKAVATVLKSSLRRGDIAARWGGEEF